jgi:type I restriction enzyme R subunit
MNEAETRAELIDPMLKNCGWGVVPDSKILREYNITDGKIQIGGKRLKKLTADYILSYKGVKLAVIEAKSEKEELGEGVAQAKLYADKLKIEHTFATNGREIYYISMKSGIENKIETYPTPDELWNKVFESQNEWRDKFNSIPFESKSGSWQPRYYQEIAVNNVLNAVASNKDRILLTLATGTGKTAISFQIAWKLFQTRWNLKKDGSRRPRILFLADRNILADQAYNSFSAFPDDVLVRIKPSEIKKGGKVPTNGSVFFTIFQTFMSGTDSDGNPTPYFGEYPADYFDFIIIDECHRGGANDESNWRGILDYFNPAIKLGLTATPKRKDNVDTYEYFGDPVYIYSLKEGINDGFLTPFKVKRVKTTLDDYLYTSDDMLIEGEIEQGKIYEEKDFNKTIEIVHREEKRVKIFLSEANQNEKAIIFCANQGHAALIRDLINKNSDSKDPFYCVRVTANDGEIGEQALREFQDNEKTIPTILTTSQKLSTGVDARNVRNIVLLRPVNSMIEFKQIVGRGTRLFEGKEFFTIYDFVDAYKLFSDKEWDGEPVAEEEPSGFKKSKEENDLKKEKERKEVLETESKKKIKVMLGDGKEREIQYMISTSFWGADGKPVSAEEFLKNLFGKIPSFFKDEDELREIWSNPITRKNLLERLEQAGYGKEELSYLQKLIDAEKSDIFDVLEYVFDSNSKPITREKRVELSKTEIFENLNEKEKEFVEFVLNKYVEVGVEELSEDKISVLLLNKYGSLEDSKTILGDVPRIRSLFMGFQKFLYQKDLVN